MLDERAPTVTADPETETLEELAAELADLDRPQAEQQARMSAYNAVKLHHQNIAVWLATKRDEADINPIPQPNIRIDLRTPDDYPERIGSFWPPILRPNVPRHPHGYQLALCKHCGEQPISLVPVGPFPLELSYLCRDCRATMHILCARVAWRTKEQQSAATVMTQLMRLLCLHTEQN